MPTPPTKQSVSRGPNGGKRIYAGRKKGSVNKLNKLIREKVAQSGLTPLEVMQQVYTKFYQEAERLAPGEAKLALYDRAVAVAHKAAPYMHGTVQPVQHNGSQAQTITHEHHVVVDPGEAYLKLVKGA